MSCVGYGAKSSLMWNFQDSFGTSQVTSLTAIQVNNVSLNRTIAELEETNMYSRFSETAYFRGQTEISGSIEAQIDPINVGWFLKSVVGLTSTTSTGPSGRHEHIFNPRTDDFDCLAAGDPATVEVHYDVDSATVFSSLVGNSISFNISNGELLNMSCDFIGAGYSYKAASSPTYNQSKPFNWSQFSGSMFGADLTEIKDLTISYNNQIESDYVLSDERNPARIKRAGMQQIEVQGTVLFASDSFDNAFGEFADTEFTAHFKDADGIEAILFTIPTLRITNFSKNISGPGLIEGSFSGRGLYNPGSGTSMSISLVNTQTYY